MVASLWLSGQSAAAWPAAGQWCFGVFASVIRTAHSSKAAPSIQKDMHLTGNIWQRERWCVHINARNRLCHFVTKQSLDCVCS